MTEALVVNKYSEMEIKNLLSKVNLTQLPEEEADIIESYLNCPKLTINNMSTVAKDLDISVDELLSEKNISMENLNFRNRKDDKQNEKLSLILKFMVVASRQVEAQGELR